MKHDLACSLCSDPGYGNNRVWGGQVLLLAVRPNLRNRPKIWVCRKCIRKNSKLDDYAFIKLFTRAKPKKT